jgi:hypothetical protein
MQMGVLVEFEITPQAVQGLRYVFKRAASRKRQANFQWPAFSIGSLDGDESRTDCKSR